jgi:hypothetical protein
MILTPGPILYLLYNFLSNEFETVALGLYAQRFNVSIIVSTFAFTMLGFLAAIITVLFSISNTKRFKRYKDKGYLDVFFFCYYITLAHLLLTFILSLLSFAYNCEPLLFHASLASMTNNIFQIFIITFTIVNLSHQVWRQANENGEVATG